eukprot:8562307-Pyramimonas_sp.AAC.1
MKISEWDALWGVECILTVIGTGGPVKRSNLTITKRRQIEEEKGSGVLSATLAVIGTGGPVKRSNIERLANTWSGKQLRALYGVLYVLYDYIAYHTTRYT